MCDFIEGYWALYPYKNNRYIHAIFIYLHT